MTGISTEAAERLANAVLYDIQGVMPGTHNGAVVATIRALAAERDALRAENARLRKACAEVSRLGSLVAHDLIGRVEGGKVAAVQRMADTARAALKEPRHD